MAPRDRGRWSCVTAHAARCTIDSASRQRSTAVELCSSREPSASMNYDPLHNWQPPRRAHGAKMLITACPHRLVHWTTIESSRADLSNSCANAGRQRRFELLIALASARLDEGRICQAVHRFVALG